LPQRFLTAFLLAAAVALLPLAAACDNGDGGASEEEIAEFEETARQLAGAGADDVDFFLDHITARALEYFGYSSPEECRANAQDCIGDPSDVERVTGTRISGGQASTNVATTDGDILQLGFVRRDDTWKLDAFAFSAAVPEGTDLVNVTAVDYEYNWDAGDIPDGQFAFAMTNGGEELHEMAVTRKTADFDLDTLIDAVANSGPEGPSEFPGVEEPAGFAFATPGATSNVVFESPLEPGDYLLICFIPDAQGTPHAALGMHSEFTIE
jgi:hypothetical protein